MKTCVISGRPVQRPLRRLRRAIVSAAAVALVCTATTASAAEFGTQLDPWESQAVIDRSYADMAAAGARWARTDGEWSTVQAGGPNSWDVTRMDRYVDAATRNGIKSMVVLTYTPGRARPAGFAGDDKAAPQGAMIDAYGVFCGRTAQHFKDTGRHVPAYEIWNEPNHYMFFHPRPDAAQYTHMLKVCALRIKAVNPQATIITGGTSPAPDTATEISPVNFVKGIYANGGKGFLDAIGAHPYTWDNGIPSKDPNAKWNAWSQMGRAGFPFPTMRSVMIENGDAARKIWATEWGASVGSQMCCGQGVVTEETQRMIYVDGMAPRGSDPASSTVNGCTHGHGQTLGPGAGPSEPAGSQYRDASCACRSSLA